MDGRIEVTQGLINITRIETIHNTSTFVAYRVNTHQKRPEVISWNSSQVTLLPANISPFDITAADYTVIRFPERKDLDNQHFFSVYQEERYAIYFIQFKDDIGETVWEYDNTGKLAVVP